MATYKRPWEESEDASKYKTDLAETEKKLAASDALYNTELDSIMKQINERAPFTYDVNADELYKQYKSRAAESGKLAMEDTIGQASSMTGGYGNSYAQMAGQQAYQAELNSADDMIPELYNLAYSRYQKEGNDLLTKYSLLADRQNTERNKLLTEREYLTGRYDTERGLDLSAQSTQSPTEDSGTTLSNMTAGSIMGYVNDYAETGDYEGLSYFLQMLADSNMITKDMMQVLLKGYFPDKYPQEDDIPIVDTTVSSLGWVPPLDIYKSTFALDKKKWGNKK